MGAHGLAPRCSGVFSARSPLDACVLWPGVCGRGRVCVLTLCGPWALPCSCPTSQRRTRQACRGRARDCASATVPQRHGRHSPDGRDASTCRRCAQVVCCLRADAERSHRTQSAALCPSPRLDDRGRACSTRHAAYCQSSVLRLGATRSFRCACVHLAVCMRRHRCDVLASTCTAPRCVQSSRARVDSRAP
eukprot:Amastigsp_a515030_6.p2 type:complete len:191 gc:universal Amastigsp_a515030_6:814-1386(+)